MRFDGPLLAGRLVRRYQRFLADVDLDDGTRVTAHCPNTGAMLGCQDAGSRVWLSRAANPDRRYPLTWELVEARPGLPVGINTGRSNGLVREAIVAGLVPELAGYAQLRPEVRLEGTGSRVDFLLSSPGRPPCYVEVKNVTAAVTDGVALFPDAVSTRAARHAAELERLRRAGADAALVFCVQREDVHTVRPAEEIDPAYARALRSAAAAGVQVLAWGATVGPREIVLRRRLDCAL